ncbi:MAG: methylmalonyl-CoA epimerase [Candidatus Heimdallarchaeota archaeon]|nr:methylmalonyl-CoA epimerase [Candidatus Heimdallarchaeota archaeon]
MTNTLSHIAIAVDDIDKAKSFFELLTQNKSSETHLIEKQKVNAAFIAIGDTTIELLDPYGQDTPISNFLSKRGGGIHHLCIKTDRFDEMVEKLKSTGIRSLGDSSIGAKGKRVIFFHPKDTFHVLIELEEH